MQSLRNAFRFISASFKLAFTHAQLRKPWLYFALGGLLDLILWLLPIALVLGLMGFSPTGLILTGALVTLFIFSMTLWGEMASLRMCRAASIIFSDHPETYPSETSISHWIDIFIFNLILPVAVVFRGIRSTLKKNDDKSEKEWTDVSFLIPPIIYLEELALSQAIQRARQIFTENLLRFRPGLIAVGLGARVTQWSAIICGCAAGVLTARGILPDPPAATVWERILGAGAGLAILWGCILLGSLFSSFTRSCYHTALYLWVRNVENARQSRDRQQAQPPKILRQVLGTVRDDKKERKNGAQKREPHLE